MKYDKILKDSFYTLDKLTLDFMLRISDAQHLMDKFALMVNVAPRMSNKKSVCRYSYHFDLVDGNSFYIGFEPNWKKFDGSVKFGRIEFNPAKVGDSLEFQSVYLELISYVGRGALKPVRFDLAIDLPVARDKVHLLKDQRTYGEVSNSTYDRTQYLGQRNNHGFVKLYNKSFEAKLKDIELTRLELTIDYDMRFYDEIKRLIPKMYCMDSFQFPLDINGTDKVILTAILLEPGLIKELGRDKRKKIEGYLEHTLLPLNLDILKYNHVLDYIETFKK